MQCRPPRGAVSEARFRCRSSEPAALDRPANPFAWQRWRAQVKPPRPGYYEVWARATDNRGRAQPPVVPGWNPEGYYNNMQHRVALFAS